MMVDNSKIGHLLRLYFSGTISPGEQKELDRWLTENEEHRAFFEHLRQDSRFASEYSLFRDVDSERAWMRFRSNNGLKRHRRVPFVLRYAAIFLVPLIVGGLWFMSRENKMQEDNQVAMVELGKADVVLETGEGGKIVLKKEQEKQIAVGRGVEVRQASGELFYKVDSGKVGKVDMNTLRVPRGGEFKLVLADGTKVYLNAATNLRYPIAFDGPERKVYLSGEAYFEVSKDEKRPFYVVTDEVQVRVYGTSFNVNTYRSEGVQTVLEEGVVGVKILDSSMEYRIEPGEMAIYNKNSGKMEIKAVDTGLYTQWRKGLFIFDRESLGNIMETLSLWYDMDVFFQSESVKNLHFSGHMKRYGQIDEILHAITDATGVVFTIKNKTVIVSK